MRRATSYATLPDPMVSSLNTQNVLRNRAEELSDVERDVLEGAISETRVFRSGHVVVRQAERVAISTGAVPGRASAFDKTPRGNAPTVDLPAVQPYCS